MISEKVIYRSHYSGENEKYLIFFIQLEWGTYVNIEMESFKAH